MAYRFESGRHSFSFRRITLIWNCKMHKISSLGYELGGSNGDLLRLNEYWKHFKSFELKTLLKIRMKMIDDGVRKKYETSYSRARRCSNVWALIPLSERDMHGNHVILPRLNV